MEEWIEGVTLRQRLAQVDSGGAPLSYLNRSSAFRQLLDVMMHLRNTRVIHGDISVSFYSYLIIPFSSIAWDGNDVCTS